MHYHISQPTHDRKPINIWVAYCVQWKSFVSPQWCKTHCVRLNYVVWPSPFWKLQVMNLTIWKHISSSDVSNLYMPWVNENASSCVTLAMYENKHAALWIENLEQIIFLENYYDHNLDYKNRLYRLKFRTLSFSTTVSGHLQNCLCQQVFM